MTMSANPDCTRSGTPPAESAPARRCASCRTTGPGNRMPRRLSSSTVNRAMPGRSMRSGPAMRSGSRGLSRPATGPSTSGGITRVSSRQCTASEPSRSSTRSESKLLRTDQSIELPIKAATSLADRTTESGPADRFSRSIFVWVLESALGVGAPTAVSATGGSLVECGPNQRAAVRMSGSRNHHAASAPARTRARHPRRKTPLRQPLTVFDLIHRTPRLERALHQVHALDDGRFLEPQPAERRLEPGEGARLRLPRRPAERHMRLEGARLRGKSERREFPLHLVLQELEGGFRRDAHPHHPRAVQIRKHAELAEGKRQGAGAGGGAAQRRYELHLTLLRYVAQELEREVQAIRAHPLHGEPQVAERRRRLPEGLPDLGGEVQRDEQPQARPARSRMRLPRR